MAEGLTDRGRPIFGPTPPGQGPPCARRSPLTGAEVAEVAALIAAARRGRQAAELPERLRTRDWDSVVAVLLAVDESLGGPGSGRAGAGWKIGAASDEIRRAERLPSPSPGIIYAHTIFPNGARLPAELFINYRCCECEFAFRLARDFPVRAEPYTEADATAGIDCLFPALEIGDTVFLDWYGSSGYYGTCLDNGGGAALVCGPETRSWRDLDLSAAGMDASLNGQYIKSGQGRAAMGHPVTSLTWMLNWPRAHGRAVRALATSSAPARAPGTCSPRPATRSGVTSARWAWSRRPLPDAVDGVSNLGVDVGTSATRVSLVRPGGHAVVASAGYRTVRAGHGRVEQDPAAWSRALAAALRLVIAHGADLSEVTAVGLCGQTPTLIPVDAAGRPVRAALTWQDTRATAEAAELADRFGDPEPLIGTALPWSAANLPAKLAWLARHEPDTVRRTRWLLQPKDLVGLWLTGSAASDPWSSKGICRVTDGEPAVAVLFGGGGGAGGGSRRRGPSAAPSARPPPAGSGCRRGSRCAWAGATHWRRSWRPGVSSGAVGSSSAARRPLSARPWLAGPPGCSVCRAVARPLRCCTARRSPAGPRSPGSRGCLAVGPPTCLCLRPGPPRVPGRPSCCTCPASARRCGTRTCAGCCSGWPPSTGRPRSPGRY